MSSLRGRYERLDARLRTLSRTRYALAMGAIAFVVSLCTSSLLGDPEVVSAGAMGVTLAAVSYFATPNRSDAASE